MPTPSSQPQRRRITIAEAEAEYTPRGEDLERVREWPELKKPFGFLNGEWEELKSQMQEGDELWQFCTDKESWDHLFGREGIELVRDGEVIASIVTELS